MEASSAKIKIIKTKQNKKIAGTQMLKAWRLTFTVKIGIALRAAQTRICEGQQT